MFERKAILEQIDSKSEEIINRHIEWLEENFKNAKKFKKFLYYLAKTDEKHLTEKELEFKREGKAMESLYQDLEDLVDKHSKELDLYFYDTTMPVYVERHPVLRELWLSKVNEVVPHIFDIADVR